MSNKKTKISISYLSVFDKDRVDVFIDESGITTFAIGQDFHYAYLQTSYLIKRPEEYQNFKNIKSIPELTKWLIKEGREKEAKLLVFAFIRCGKTRIL